MLTQEFVSILTGIKVSYIKFELICQPELIFYFREFTIIEFPFNPSEKASKLIFPSELLF